MLRYKIVTKDGKVFEAEQGLSDELCSSGKGIQRFSNAIDSDGISHYKLYIPTRNIAYAYREK